MVDFYKEIVRTAQKEYTCEMCGRKIHAGEMYWRESGMFCGEFFDRKMHHICHQFEKEYCENIETEFNWWQVSDYIQQKYCRDCEHSQWNDDKENWTECDTNIYECQRIRELMRENMLANLLG